VPRHRRQEFLRFLKHPRFHLQFTPARADHRTRDARAVSGEDLRILLRLLDAMDDHFDRRISDQEFLRL
jgi:hypothetical protein